MSADLARIEKAGLITRKPGRDRRHVELAVTEKGMDVMLEVAANLEKIIRSRIGDRSKAEIDSFTKLLSDLQGIQFDN
jgi:DNA-binding MarR family transcriptional regulator